MMIKHEKPMGMYMAQYSNRWLIRLCSVNYIKQEIVENLLVVGRRYQLV